MESLKNIMIQNIVKNYDQYKKLLQLLPNDLRYPINSKYLRFLGSSKGICFDIVFNDFGIHISNGEYYSAFNHMMHRAKRKNIMDKLSDLYYIIIKPLDDYDNIYILDYHSNINGYYRAMIRNCDKLIELCKQYNMNPYIDKLVKIKRQNII